MKTQRSPTGKGGDLTQLRLVVVSLQMGECQMTDVIHTDINRLQDGET